ncbi:MAG: hypothetical protein LLG01_01350 [Planctomycetaceae bacterium]|nr:hypothetical protein [Planctomycetaceae bacterium]
MRALASLMVLALASAALAAEGARSEEMKDLARQAQSLAQEWLDGPANDQALDMWIKQRPVSSKLEVLMKDLWYDAQSVDILQTLLQQRRGEAADLYAANCLLRPLLNAKTEVIASALPAVEALHQRLGKYVAMPQYTPAQLETFKLNPEDKTQDAAKLRQARIEKLKKELAPKFQNEQAAILTRSLARLMVYADQAATDQKLIDLIAATERDGQWDYTVMLEAVRSESAKMKKERADRFYQAFYTLWNEILQRQDRVRKYDDPAAAKITVDGAPEEVTHQDNAGERFLKVLNQLAVTARQPALQNPRPRKSGKQPDARPRR